MAPPALSASVENLRYQVIVDLHVIPAHAWFLSIAERILALACSNLKAPPQTIAKVDMCRFVVSVWCIHQDLIPCEKIIFIPESEVAHVYGPPMFLKLEEVIDTHQLMMRHHALIRTLKIEDWHIGSNSSSDGESDGGG
jgi:hypothetical protein